MIGYEKRGAVLVLGIQRKCPYNVVQTTLKKSELHAFEIVCESVGVTFLNVLYRYFSQIVLHFCIVTKFLLRSSHVQLFITVNYSV